ncbi:adenosylcobinamide-GDP ribazoletransferase [Halomonas sp. ANAO-440]|uniref:adenosylcobinamide-GDP ribazoletransferase n=1 Tax=Halomonas sp. ANAO-440 TaxID=2861360 RepID=UPI001CAA53BB|nr:adenosylcobinamide-GDP ribazoletransferase [Halomonas sp. ANAO-440]MBZ0328986.1 adenosylcobinamide-GDP ribazoletransferase [Halomonas sp. ANAO-440]
MREAGYGLLLAIQFLTRLPVPVACPWTPATSRWALRCYPLVGLLLGAILASIGALLQSVLPTPMLALLLLSLWVALSGGLHLDGLMDVADALGSNAPLERRWEIMKDPQVGSFGILALVFLLAWKVTLLWTLLEAGVSLVVLVVVPALGRLGGVALLLLAPCARREGLAWAWRQHLQRRDLAFSLVPLVAVFWLLPGGLFLASGLAALLLGCLLLFLLGYGLLMSRALGGVNGDIVGAAIEAAELWLLLIVWVWWVTG